MIAPDLVLDLQAIAAERLATVEALIAELDPDAPGEALRTLARELHTLKGEARLVGLAAVAARVHDAEGVAAELASDVTSESHRRALYAALDAVAESLAVSAAPAARDGVRPSEARVARLTELALAARSGDAAMRGLSGELAQLREELAAMRAALAGSAPDRHAIGLRLDRVERHAANLATAARAVSADAREHADALEASARELGLVPLGGLFASQRAAVRRMALEQDKEVALDTLGGDIEVDAEVLEALRVPLVHLLRNAVDHGLERPDERLAVGKESCGCVVVRARVDGSEVEVEVADDGRGVDVEAVRRRAQALGALGPDASDDEALRAVLLPGLSTQVKASVTSGRGVGLDAVASALIAVGGRVEVSSERGRGTSIRLRVPGSRVVSRGAVLEAGGSAWVVPARAVGVVLDAAAAPLEPAGAGWVMRLEDERLRYLSLADAIGAPASALPRRVVVLRDGRGEVALGVDRCRGVQRVTVRRDTVLVADLELLSGAAVLEDGEVVPMLDVAALMRLDGVGAARARSSAHVGRRRVLVVDDSELMRDVAASALREMGHEVLEAVDGRDALRVIAEGRPQLVVTDLDMPVMDGFALLEALRAAPETEHLPVVVFTSSEGDASVRRAGALGADAYVVKSRLSRVELERAVLGLLSREVA
ncbi:MAG: hypothetical protein SangKO_087200 [Sandaracinaceae bacterium]